MTNLLPSGRGGRATCHWPSFSGLVVYHLVSLAYRPELVDQWHVSLTSFATRPGRFDQWRVVQPPLPQGKKRSANGMYVNLHFFRIKYSLYLVYHSKHGICYSLLLQKPANILVMGDGPERGRVKIGQLGVCVQCFPSSCNSRLQERELCHPINCRRI